MTFTKRKGYRVERKIRQIFEQNGWKVIRAGASLGEADLICVRNKKCIFLQVKSTRKKVFYYYDYKQDKIEGFPFYLIVDFGYGNIRVLKPKEKIKSSDGKHIKDFLSKI
jgi:Holliday junction resolvase